MLPRVAEQDGAPRPNEVLRPIVLHTHHLRDAGPLLLRLSALRGDWHILRGFRTPVTEEPVRLRPIRLAFLAIEGDNKSNQDMRLSHDSLIKPTTGYNHGDAHTSLLKHCRPTTGYTYEDAHTSLLTHHWALDRAALSRA